jgi:hypothetical protein
VSQSVVEGLVELRLGGWFSRCTMCLRVLTESFTTWLRVLMRICRGGLWMLMSIIGRLRTSFVV